MENLYTKTIEFLKRNKEYAIKSSDNGVVLNYIKINKHIEELNSELINYLSGDSYFFENYFKKIGDVHVFNQNLIIKILFKYKEYMMGSVTSYDNKIGLFVQDNDQVVLNFPYKDCVLVGGMDSEDEKIGTEFFYNEILDRDKISKLFQPKVFHNVKKFSYVKSLAVDDNIQNTRNIQVENNISSIGFKAGKLNDNLLVKGNNLLALHSLSERLSNSVDVIYIDPPYYFNDKKQEDSFAYNSNFKLSSWLTFMKNRLEIARELLSDDGVIFCSMNDFGFSYLDILLKEVFYEKNQIGIFNWNHSKTPPNLSKKIKKTVDYIIVFQKNKNDKKFTGRQKKSKSSDPMTKNSNSLKTLSFPINSVIFSNDDEEVKKIDVYGTKSNPVSLLEECFFSNGTNKKVLKLKANFVWTQEKLENEIKKGTKIFISKNIVVSYKKNNYDPEVPPSLIDEKVSVDTTEASGKYLNDVLFADKKNKVFKFPKPVSLIEYLINFVNKRDAIVLDFFAGSGTTAQSILSLNKEDGGNRKFILIEQMDYIENITAERIRRCMIKEGYEDSFVYLEMFESEIKKIKKQIKLAESIKDLEDIVNKMFDTGCFININSKSDLLLKMKEQKSINDIKKILLERYMDNNLDYISFSDIEELRCKGLISENEYRLNKGFYNRGNDE